MTTENLKKILTKMYKDNPNVYPKMLSDTVDGMSEDIDIIMKKEKSTYSISIWDKTSPINGVPASYMLSQEPFDIPGWTGATYLISKNGQTLFMQHVDPTKRGRQPMTPETALMIAETQLIPILEEAVIATAISKLRGE